MPRRPGSNRELDLQSLRKAGSCIARAIELFVNKDDKDAVAQAGLAERFIGEFMEKRDDGA